MKKLIILLALFSFSAYAESMSKSCSGTIRYCDQYGICTDEYYYLYAYQYVKFNRSGELTRYRNRFRFRGYVLGEEDQYEYSGTHTRDHLLYSGPDFDLAIPWNVNIPIFMVHHDSGQWEELCP